jgi:hypothetical protein
VADLQRVILAPVRREIYRCARCGASTSPKLERCEYCDAWLVHLTMLERDDRDDTAAGQDVPRFRSLRGLYGAALVASGVLFVVLYFVSFEGFSETELVALSPLWFLGFQFGMSGLFTERALDAVLRGEARTFREGLARAMGASAPLVRLAVLVVFFPPFLLFGLRRLTSPLLLSVTTTLAWAALLYGFLFAIFPSL